MLETALTLKLILDRPQCIRGESVFFEMVLSNPPQAPAQGVIDFTWPEPGLELLLQGPDGPRTAHPESPQERDGIHRHAPMVPPPVVTLAPGGKMTLRDDVLRWFGELKPGNYQLTARHDSGAESEPVPLKVLAAAPIFMSTPHVAAQAPGAPMTGAWVHRQAKGFLVFGEQRGAILPRNPVHDLRVTEVDTPVQAFAATLADSSVKTPHVVWRSEKGDVFFAALTADGSRPPVVFSVTMPFKNAEFLASPVSVPDGRLFVPVTDAKRGQVTVLEVSAKGEVKPYDLDLGKAAPLGPYCCFWEYDAQLHFFWVAEKGREVNLAQLSLQDPTQGFITKSVYTSDNPIICLEAYFDPESSINEAPYLEHEVPPEQQGQPMQIPGPRLMLWVASAASAGIQCTRVNLKDNLSKPAALLPTTGLKPLTVISSAISWDKFQLCMLLADPTPQLFYASTGLNAVKPLKDVAGKDITDKDFPGLVAATRAGSYPWVYLRYVRDKEAIDYLRLEPPDVPDPVERHAEAGRPRR